MASRFLNSNLFSPDDECPAGKSGESWADSMNPAITATVVEPKCLFPDKEQASVLVTRAYRPATRHGWQKCAQTEKEMEEAAVAKQALSAAVHVSVNVSGPGGAPQVPESAPGPGAAEVVPAEVAVEPSASSLPVQTKEEKRAAKKAAKAEKAATKAAEKAAKKAAKAAAKKPAAKPTAKKAAAKQGSNDHDDGKQGGPADTLQDEDTMMEAEVQDDDPKHQGNLCWTATAQGPLQAPDLQ